VANLCTVNPYELTKTREIDNKEIKKITKDLLSLKVK
jgi:hypothetical protein